MFSSQAPNSRASLDTRFCPSGYFLGDPSPVWSPLRPFERKNLPSDIKPAFNISDPKFENAPCPVLGSFFPSHFPKRRPSARSFELESVVRRLFVPLFFSSPFPLPLWYLHVSSKSRLRLGAGSSLFPLSTHHVYMSFYHALVARFPIGP